jgi:hypothetical protein
MHACEICGARDSDKSEWFLVTPGGANGTLEILDWNEDRAARPNMFAVCCPDHVEQLVTRCVQRSLPHEQSQWVPWGTALHEMPRALDEHRCGEFFGSLNLDRACLPSGLETDRKSLLEALDAVEVALQTRAEEEDGALVYDA